MAVDQERAAKGLQSEEWKLERRGDRNGKKESTHGSQRNFNDISYFQQPPRLPTYQLDTSTYPPSLFLSFLDSLTSGKPISTESSWNLFSFKLFFPN